MKLDSVSKTPHMQSSAPKWVFQFVSEFASHKLFLASTVYNTHHDYIPHQKTRQCGPRILTFFMYLSDVDAGGGTDFPDLGITVMPKKGRALLWPSVYNAGTSKLG